MNSVRPICSTTFLSAGQVKVRPSGTATPRDDSWVRPYGEAAATLETFSQLLAGLPAPGLETWTDPPL